MKSSHETLILVTAIIIFCAGIAMIIAGTVFLVNSSESNEQLNCTSSSQQLLNVEFDPDYLRLTYAQKVDQHRTILSVHLGQTPLGDGPLTAYPRLVNQCSDHSEDVCATVTYTTEDKEVDLGLTVDEIVTTDDITCYETTWESSSDEVAPTDCFPMVDYWFGGAEMYYQDWPINSWGKHMSFYLSGDMFSDPQQYGSVLERYWLSSQGVALYVYPNIPLHVSTEKQQICFKGAYEDPYKVRSPYHDSHWLQYVTCFGRTPQITHDFIFKTFFFRPTVLPDTRMMKSPIWSTWARYKVNINESVVLGYAQEILDHGFSNSQLEIDDGYEVHYGDHTFDPKKFSNASGMIDTLHNLGFRITTWVTPFINPTSINYESGDNNTYFIVNGNTGNSGKVPWWNGIGSSIDFTNTDACDWYSGLLNDVRNDFGVDSYKFDAGEINYVTAVPNFQTHEANENIGRYTQKYAECAYRLGNQIEVRSAWNCQHLPIFVRMMDKDSNWGPAKGLKTLIPTALTFSLLGYPYILPDMIGGNAYEAGFHESPLPERELFIRWLQLTAFLPSMQFSYVPWQYDNDTAQIAREFVTLHETVVYDELVKASNDYIRRKSGIGPIRPIWWVSTDDSHAFTVDDEFMLGDRYLVAPVVENATRSRDVYLPGPLWRDGSKRILWEDKLRSGAKILGGITIQNYRVELEEISWWELTLI